MKTEIERTQVAILRRVSEAANQGNIEEVTRLSALATKTRDLLVTIDRVAADLSSIEASLDGIPGKIETPAVPDKASPGRARGSTFEVAIDWSRNGKPLGQETISETLGSATLVKTIERLVEVLGSRVLEVGSRIKVNRGPMLSREPLKDYRNMSSGGSFQHQAIGSTGYFALTNTETDQKVQDMTALLRELGLTPGSYSVRKLAR